MITFLYCLQFQIIFVILNLTFRCVTSVIPAHMNFTYAIVYNDTLDHTISLDKLLYHGIKGTELAWFKSYLTNRTQFVSYNGTNSRTLSITTGVPPGSILGPLLFIIYMNDIHNASSKFHAILFTDDTNLTSTLCSFDVNIDNNCNSLQLSTNINKELKNIQIWLEINKLSLNVKKTKFMIFHHKQQNIENLIPQLNLNEQIIERVTDFDFLGLTIDQYLTWNGHVQKISNKISRSLGIMCKLKRFLPQNILKILYNSLILPHLQYCILSWSFKSDRIFKLQKRAVRIITCSKYNDHTEPLLKTLNLPKIEDIMKTKALKLYYRYKKNELPKYFESMFTESNDNHSHDTRQVSSISITNKDKHWSVMYKALYTRTTFQNTWMYNWKARYSFIQWFFKLHEKLLYSEL